LIKQNLGQHLYNKQFDYAFGEDFDTLYLNNNSYKSKVDKNPTKIT